MNTMRMWRWSTSATFISIYFTLRSPLKQKIMRNLSITARIYYNLTHQCKLMSLIISRSMVLLTAQSNLSSHRICCTILWMFLKTVQTHNNSTCFHKTTHTIFPSDTVSVTSEKSSLKTRRLDNRSANSVSLSFIPLTT